MQLRNFFYRFVRFNKVVPRSVKLNAVVFCIALVVVIGTFIVRSDAPTVAAAGENKNKYMDFGKDLDGMVGEYHDALNELFNARIETMLKAKEDQLLVLIRPPEPDPQFGIRDCQGKKGSVNLSTYCLSEAALSEFYLFRKAIESARDLLSADLVSLYSQASAIYEEEKAKERQKGNKVGSELFGGIFSELSGGSGITDYSLQIKRVDIELDIAKQTLDSSLAAYSEMQMALPLHRKYQQMIKSLETYRDAVADIRDEVTIYPFKFHNVSTTQCT